MKQFFYRRFRQIEKWCKTKLKHKALLLLYHRVKDLEIDPQLLGVAPVHFEQHLDILSRDYKPISLNELCRAIEERRVPPRAVAVTFDDGYSDNLYHAKPLLERYEVPATVFVTCGKVRKRGTFWSDELADVFLQPRPLPLRLDLTIRDKPHHWELGNSTRATEESASENRKWHILERMDPTPRHAAYRSLCRLLRDLPDSEREDVVNGIREWAGTTDAAGRDDFVLSAEDILLIEQGGLVEVGSHTMTHPVLASLPPEKQLDELRASKRVLEDILGHSVGSFAYPFGSKSDYTKETVSIVRNCGFACACSNYRDLVWRYSNLFELPRFIVESGHDR